MNWYKKASADFPENLSALEKVKNLGGSTGAILVKDKSTGKLYVQKGGAHADQARHEYDLNRFMKGLGRNVPNAKLYEQDGKPILLTEFLPHPTMGDHQGSNPNSSVEDSIKQDYAAHALIGNWDVVGLDKDNVLVDDSGKPYYVDLGGGGPWRAMGSPKGDAWNEHANEYDSMKRGIFESMSDDDIRQQVNNLNERMPSALQSVQDPKLRDMLQRRYQSMLSR